MVRQHLEEIPDFPLPAGFSLRWYQPGDEEHWVRIHLAADDENEITPTLFQRAFGSNAAPLASRQCYLVAPGGAVIGTATAWFDDNFEGARFGRVHYVALLPEYQGRGLAKPLMTAVCQRLRELGHDRAYLVTASSRVRALKLYARFGFQPLSRRAEEVGL
jgi:ribosomal protein S18 acetylase RimI-like enzyme